MKKCYKCGMLIEIERVSRRDECPNCGSDLHVCLNCRFYDETKANSCIEIKAERQREKDRANFCEYFEFREQKDEKKGKKEAEKLWEELFGRKK
ncbi:MAG: hypothetical protein N2513_05055 [Deltaproteobacteria bacterium]|nr:hypothetical protein [Deltaproteobacteria bacterium]